ncbi:MAG: hypothetical protein K8R25_09450 [Methanosarcinales archaeon]|nr:hypothetical protein [Methanosarcinales archaeon]
MTDIPEEWRIRRFIESSPEASKKLKTKRFVESLLEALKRPEDKKM